jgi:hypothetical protein
LISFFLVTLLDNSIVVGGTSNSTKIVPPKESKDLTSQDRVVVKLTPTSTSAEGNVSPKNIKVKVGTTVVWQNMLPEKVYVQSKPDGNHYEGQLLNASYIFPGESREEKLHEVGTFIYDGGNGFGSYYVRGAITVVNETSDEKSVPTQTIKNQSPISHASVSINPACGPSGSASFEVSINGNGFKSNTNVGWMLEEPDKSVPFYGYFETDDKGAFKGKTLFDDLKTGNYKMHFGENVDSYGRVNGESKVTLGITVPCSDERESQGPTTAPKSKKSYQLIVYLDDASPQNAIGDNFKVVVHNSNNETILSAKPNIDFNDNHQKISPRDGYPIILQSGQSPKDITVCAEQEYQSNGTSYLHSDCYPIKQNVQKTYWYTTFDYSEIDGFEEVFAPETSTESVQTNTDMNNEDTQIETQQPVSNDVNSPTLHGKSYFREIFESETDDPVYVVSHSTKKDKILDPIYELVGEIKNRSDEEVTYVKIIATFYDDKGIVIGTDYTYTDPSDLNPGRTAPYSLTIGFGDTIDINDIAEAKYHLEWD